jgi:acetyltransferase-like isoleucine patch superfamily enzyme
LAGRAEGSPLKLKLVLAHLVAALPGNAVRVLCYRALFGYRIRGSRIGWQTVIHVADAEFRECRVGHHNRFVGPMSVRVMKGADIGSHNAFECGQWTRAESAEPGAYERRLEIGEHTLISSRHYIDVAGSFVLGHGSWIGGVGSQFWTHGAGVKERNIKIGERCYVGSGVIFAPGAGLANNTMVALGSLVSRRFHRPNVVIGGVPAVVLREDFDWRTQQAMAETRPGAGAQGTDGLPRDPEPGDPE